MKRRTFLRRSSLGLAGAGLAAAFGGRASGEAEAPATRLVKVDHAGATDETGAGHAAVVKRMVDRAVKELSGKDSLAAAWAEYVKPDDVVGLKLNVRGGKYISVQPCVVDAIVAGLTAAGVAENNIIVWDMWMRELPIAGYTLNSSDQGVRCYATERGSYEPGKGRSHSQRREALKPFYESDPVTVADKQVWFSKILTREVTALINVPMIKDHTITGVTCAMKNHYGAILNPSDLHGNRCDPYIAALNLTPQIKDKARLVLVDGLRALYHGGPHDNPKCRWRQNSIVAGTDPVAVDALALKILDAKREAEGMDPIRHKAQCVATAAKMGLGTNDPDRIDLREIDLAAEA